MIKDEALKMALETLGDIQEACSEDGGLEHFTVYCPDVLDALRQALDQLPDTTKMINPEELVCICGAIWQGQELICPPKCLEEGIEREMPIDRGAWSDVPDATKWVDELRGDEEPPNSTTGVVESEITQSQELFGKTERLESENKRLQEREWIKLTDAEIAEAVGSPLDEVYLADFRKIEAKLKEKNT